MQVPTYKATAKRSTGVSGQQMSFKVPGGALSQGQIAQSQGLEKISQAAAQWGAVSYGMHRNQVVGKAIEKADASINNIYTEAQRKDINAPRDQDQPIGFFNGRGKQLVQESVMGIKDPFIKADIRSKLNTRLGNARRKLQTWNNATLIDQAQASITANTEQNLKKIAAFIPFDWNGKIENLPAEAQNFFLETVQMQENAVKQNIISYEKFEKFTRSFPSRLSKLSVEKRLLASRNSDDTELILRDLADSSKYTYLSAEDRQNLKETGDRKATRQISKENSEAIKKDKQDAKILKSEQKNNSDALYKRLIENQINSNSKPVTMDEILNANVSQQQREILRKIYNEETPSQSNMQYVANAFEELNAIDNDDDYAINVEESLDDFDDVLLAELAKGPDSQINITDYNNLKRRIDTIRNKDGLGPNIKLLEQFIEDSAPKSVLGTPLEPDKLLLAKVKATEFFIQTGDTRAAQVRALQILLGKKIKTIIPVRHIYTNNIPTDIKDFKKNLETNLFQLNTKAGLLTDPKKRDEALRDIENIKLILKSDEDLEGSAK